MFVASGSARGVAVANLADFRRMETIPLPHAPDQLLAGSDRVYSLSREGSELIEIDPAKLAVTGRIALPGNPATARFTADRRFLLIALDSPAALVAVDPANRRIAGRVTLPGPPTDLDVSQTMAAVAVPGRHSVVRIGTDPASLKLLGSTEAGVACQILRFRNDGLTILAGSAEARQVVTLDAASGMLLARLPLPIAASRFCFNPDGGQMFVTGEGQDSVAIVSPYQNEVGETMLAGRTPEAMAVSAARNLLFVTNRESGDLTILNIDTRELAASVHVGGMPGELLLTPDGEYALVLDRGTGNVAVVRLDTVLERNGDVPAAAKALRTKPLFTTFATAGDARSALIVPSPLV